MFKRRSKEDVQIDLLPCPFCGSTDLSFTNLSSTVRCNGCGMASTMSTTMIAAGGAAKTGRLNMLAICWNRRAETKEKSE